MASNSVDVNTSFNRSFKSIPKIDSNIIKIYNANSEDLVYEYSYDIDVFDDYYEQNKPDYKKYWRNKAIDIGVGTLSNITAVPGFFGLSLGTFNVTSGIKEKLKGSSWSDAMKAVTDTPGMNNEANALGTFFGPILGNYTWAEWFYQRLGSSKSIEVTSGTLTSLKTLATYDFITAKNLLKYGPKYKYEAAALTEEALNNYKDAKNAIVGKGFGFSKIKEFRDYKSNWMKLEQEIPDEWLSSKSDFFKKIERKEFAFALQEEQTNYFSKRFKSTLLDAGFYVASKISSDYISALDLASELGDNRFRNDYFKKSLDADFIAEIAFGAAGIIVFETVMPVGGYAVGVNAFNTLYDGVWKLCEYSSGLKRPTSEYDRIKFDRTLTKIALDNTGSAKIYENNKDIYAKSPTTENKIELDDSAIRYYVDDIGYGTPQALVNLAKQYENGTIQNMPYLDGGRYNQFGVNKDWYYGKSGLDSVGFANYLLLNSGFGIDVNSIEDKYRKKLDTNKFLLSAMPFDYKDLGTMLIKKDAAGNTTDVGFIVGTGKDYIEVLYFDRNNGANVRKFTSYDELIKAYDEEIDRKIYDVLDYQNYSRPDIQQTESEIKEGYNIRFYSRSYTVENYMKELYKAGEIDYSKYQESELYLAADKISGVDSVGNPNGGYATGIAVGNVANFFYSNSPKKSTNADGVTFIAENDETICIEYADSGGYTGFGIPKNGFKGNSYEFTKWVFQNGGIKLRLDKLPKATKLPDKTHKYTSGDILYKDLDNDGKYSEGDLYLTCTGGTCFKGIDPRTGELTEVEFNCYDKNSLDSYRNEYEYINMRKYIDTDENKDFKRPDMSLYSVKNSQPALDFYEKSKELYYKNKIPKYTYHNASVNYQVNKNGYGTLDGLSALIQYTRVNNDDFSIPYSSDGEYNKFGVDQAWYSESQEEKTGLSSYGYIEWLLTCSGYKVDENTFSQMKSLKYNKDSVGPFNGRVEINDKFYIDVNHDGKYSDDECYTVSCITEDEIMLYPPEEYKPFSLEDTRVGIAIPLKDTKYEYVDKDGNKTTKTYTAPTNFDEFMEKLAGKNGDSVEHVKREDFGSYITVSDIGTGDVFYDDEDGDGKITNNDTCWIVESNNKIDKKGRKYIIVATHGVDADGNAYTDKKVIYTDDIHDWQGLTKEIGATNYIPMNLFYNNPDNINSFDNSEYINQRDDIIDSSWILN